MTYLLQPSPELPVRERQGQSPERLTELQAFIAKRRAWAIEYGHWNYVAQFDTGRLKVGVTNDPAKRFSYYLQEARRHDIGDVGLYAFGGFLSRPEVLAIERALCRQVAAPSREFGNATTRETYRTNWSPVRQGADDHRRCKSRGIGA